MLKKQMLLTVFFASLLSVCYAQEAKFKALYMYNFIRYIEWPDEKHQGDFVIGIFGSSPVVEELKIIADKKKIGAQTIQVREIENPSDLASCHILYVPENRSGRLNEIISQNKGKGTVIITDKPGLGKTVAGINYINIDGKQSFEINRTNLEKQGVKINSTLLSLGVSID